MGNGIYDIDHKKSSKYLSKYIHSKKGYVISIITIVVLPLLFCIYKVVKYVLKSNNPTTDDIMIYSLIYLIGYCFLVCFFVIPRRKYTSPFLDRYCEKIIIYDDGLEYVYKHSYYGQYADRNGNNKRAVYRIYYSNIRNIEYDDKYHILYITGFAESVEYRNFAKRELLTSNTALNENFDENTRYPIMLTLTNYNEKAFVANLKQRVGLML